MEKWLFLEREHTQGCGAWNDVKVSRESRGRQTFLGVASTDWFPLYVCQEWMSLEEEEKAPRVLKGTISQNLVLQPWEPPVESPLVLSIPADT